ncbi:MAG: hypothetical protein ACRDHY_19100, partial [Anaerolineales bacterium]
LSAEVGVVTLDLAELYLRQGRVAEVLGAVAEAVPIFQALGIRRELLAALLKVREVAHHQQAAIKLLRNVVQAVRAGGLELPA